MIGLMAHVDFIKKFLSIFCCFRSMGSLMTVVMASNVLLSNASFIYVAFNVFNPISYAGRLKLSGELSNSSRCHVGLLLVGRRSRCCAVTVFCGCSLELTIWTLLNLVVCLILCASVISCHFSSVIS